MTGARSGRSRVVAWLILAGLLCASLDSTARAQSTPAQPTLAVLDFELNDLTPLPNTDAERERTASLRPMLEHELRAAGDVRLVDIDPAAARKADAAVGYLFEHPEVTARLGAVNGADWVVVGRVHKPSYLFVYLMARLVDTHSGAIAEDLLVEIKGQQDVVSRKGIERLAQKLSTRLRAGVAERAR